MNQKIESSQDLEETLVDVFGFNHDDEGLMALSDAFDELTDDHRAEVEVTEDEEHILVTFKLPK